MATAKEPVKKQAAPVHHRAAAHPAAHPAHASHATARPAHATHAPAHAAHPAAPHASPPRHARYTEAVGRRKTAIARVRIAEGSGKMLINGKEPKSYFSLQRLLAIASAPLEQMNLVKQFDVSITVSGGGISAQAEAIRHGISRAIILRSPEWKPRLRAVGYLTRDSRMVERKKYGLKKARRAPQWAKR